jgi:retron-type reverse transcriptase
VFPLYKGSGKKSDFSNYRPISQLPSLSKLFEKHIFRTLSEFLDINSYLSPNQFGFRRNRSTIDALLQIQKTICDARHKSLYVCVIAIDFKKAFDILCRKILFRKLASLRLSLKSINLIKSYLTDRKQLVSLYGKKSTLLSLDIGVILGSVIEPLLFSMYINDITKIGLNCKTILYDSDT